MDQKGEGVGGLRRVIIHTCFHEPFFLMLVGRVDGEEPDGKAKHTCQTTHLSWVTAYEAGQASLLEARNESVLLRDV